MKRVVVALACAALAGCGQDGQDAPAQPPPSMEQIRATLCRNIEQDLQEYASPPESRYLGDDAYKWAWYHEYCSTR
jgi:nitrous oxide reductase accessory protein NosL